MYRALVSFTTNTKDYKQGEILKDNFTTQAEINDLLQVNYIEIYKKPNEALSFSNYSEMITEFNSLENNIYNIGQSIKIIALNVPDLWISSVESTSQTYTYTTDDAFTTSLATNGYVQVGYYKLSALETQKVDLSDYAKKTDLPNKLADLTDDSTHRLVTDTEKTTWNAKGTYSKPSSGIPKTDLDSSVQASLDKADTALQTHQDISGKLDTSKVKNTASTTAGDVYDVRYINTMLGDIETILTTLTTGSGV